MRPATLLSACGAILLLASPLAAQRISTPSDPDRNAPPRMASSGFTLPTVAQVREHSNVADLLIDKRKKLGLDQAAVDALTAMSRTIEARNAPDLATYDSLRIKSRAASLNGGNAPDPEARARMQALGGAVQALVAARASDETAALALVPADKQDEARKLLADQAEDLRKAAGPRGGGPGAGPGSGPGGRPQRPSRR